jgi:stage III sporulation protein AG
LKEKLKDDKFVKDLLYKFLSVLVIAVAALLLLNVMTQNKDGRKQIIDEDGGSEYSETASPTNEERKLAEILGSIKGVGDVNVMISYDRSETNVDFFQDKKAETAKVKGAVITATGGGEAVTKHSIIDAVTALYDIPVQNVKVFEKEGEGNK